MADFETLECLAVLVDAVPANLRVFPVAALFSSAKLAFLSETAHYPLRPVEPGKTPKLLFRANFFNVP